MGRVHNVGRNTARRGRVAKIDGLDVYINQLFRADENKMPKYSVSTAAMRADQNQIVSDIRSVLPRVFKDMLEQGRDAATEFGMQFEEFVDDVVEATPWHEEGPSDPPFHAAEAWKSGFYPNGKNGFTLTLYNPKDYMPFLEAGWSPQAPAGWIAGLWAAFMLRLQNG